MIKVISGGQTGVDRIALEEAKKLGIPTGGMAPKEWRTEIGADPSLLEFGLIESTSSSYAERTSWNVENSDGTIIFGDITSSGSKLTQATCESLNKPFLTNPSVSEMITWVRDNRIQVINFAGNRLSVLGNDKAVIIREVISNFLSELSKGFSLS